MAQMRKIIPLVALVAALAIAPAASASHGCSKHAKGGKVTHKTKESHVFEKNDRWWGCTTKTGRPHVLPGLDRISAGRQFGDGTIPTSIRLSGVYVAYERYTLHPAGGPGDTQTDIYVVDLRTGKVVVDEEARAPTGQQEDRDINDLVLKRNGSIAWISTHWTYAQYPGVVNYEVHRFSRDPAAPGRTTIDSGADIERQSLELSSDRRTITWVKGGETKSAPLP